MCIMFVYALLKVASYYNLCVLSMSVVGGVSSVQVYFGFLELF